MPTWAERRRLECCAAALAILCARFGQAAGFPVTVTSCGRPVTFASPPRHAVFDDINMAEMAFALHLQPDIAGLTGVTGWYHVTPEFLAKAGAIPELAPKYPSLEQLVGAHADLFVAGWYYGMKPGGEVTPDTLAAWHIPTLVLTESCIHVDRRRPPASLDLLYGDEMRLGQVFGREREAAKLVEGWRARVSAVGTRLANQPHRRVFIYDSGKEAPFTAGRFAMASAIIRAAGGTNVTDDLPTSWGTASWDSIALKDPQLIILLDDQSGGAADSLLAALREQPAMRLLSAVRQGAVLRLRYEALTPGPANIDAIETLARSLHPDAFTP